MRTCGTCDDWDLCVPCWRSGKSHCHQLYSELVPRTAPEEGARRAIDEAGCCAGALLAALEAYGDRRCLGWRERVSQDVFAWEFSWISFGEVRERSIALGAGILASVGLEIETGSVVSIVGASSVAWLLSYCACALRGWTILPVHPSLSVERLAATLQIAKPRVVLCSKHMTRPVLAGLKSVLLSCPVVEFDDCADAYCLRRHGDECLPWDLSASPPVLCWTEVLERGSRSAVEPFVAPNVKQEDLVLLLPSSGTSSSRPKLIMVTDGMLRLQLRSSDTLESSVVLAYEPLRQILDVFCKGGRVGVWSGSQDRLFDDLKALRPTVFGAMPTFWNGLHCRFQQELRTALANRGDLPETRVRRKLLHAWQKRKIFGNRLMVAVTGGAPIAPDVLLWMKQVLCCVLDGYGSTETGGLTANGSVHPGSIVQLMDCPHLGYLTSDKPNPRGEIVACTPRLSPGYYGDQEATEQSFVTIAGRKFFRTGDIGEMVDGKIRVIDRAACFFKLAQGSFVSPEVLELVYLEKIPAMRQVYIWGTGTMSRVAAVVVPANVMEDTRAQERDLLAEFRRIGSENGRSPWEIPEAIVIEKEPFTQWNGLLSAGGKLCRHALALKYRGETPPSVPPPDIHVQTTSPLCAGLVDLLVECTGIRKDLLDPTLSLTALGVDSVRIALVSSKIREHFAVTIPLPAIASSPSLLALQDMVFGGSVVQTVSDEFFAMEVEQVWQDLECCDFAQCSRGALSGGVMLTGATGFLGAFMLRELLHSTYEAFVPTTIYCLMRARDDDSALERILANLHHYGLADVIPSSTRIVPVRGDLCLPRFGLDEAQFRDLATRIDLVLHNGSLVSAALDYKGHRASNVLGSQQVLSFASISRAAVVYVSTAAVISGSGMVLEDAAPALGLSRLGGYAQSKWVAEKLFLRAKEKGLSCRVFRPATVIGDSRTGVVSEKEFFTALVREIARDCLCCTAPDSPLPQTFVTVPVDVVASCVVSTSLRMACGQLSAPGTIFHLVGNPCSLPELVCHIRECGITVEEVPAPQYSRFLSSIDQTHPLFPFKSMLLLQTRSAPLLPPLSTINSSALLSSLNLPGPSTSFLSGPILRLMLKST